VNLVGTLTILLRSCIAGIGAARGHRRPASPRELAGDVSAPTPVTNQAKVNPSSILVTSPAKPGLPLAGLWLPPPAMAPKYG
jgi:hypothetical protein